MMGLQGGTRRPWAGVFKQVQNESRRTNKTDRRPGGKRKRSDNKGLPENKKRTGKIQRIYEKDLFAGFKREKNYKHTNLKNMEKNLPSLSELHHDVNAAFKNDQLNLLLNQPPHAAWVKKHPMTKTDYIPIDKIEFLLTRIFQEWHVEIKQVQQLFQSVVTTVRLHIKNPITGEWFYQDGVGAAPIQTDAGKSAADLAAIKANAVQIAAPSSESYAVKDAAEKLGNLFGKDLNRKDTVMFAGAYSDMAVNGAPKTKSPSFQTTDL